MKHLVLLPLVLGLISTPSALALSARTISAEQAQGTTGSIVTLEVAPGYGLNINLIPTGEILKKAWIDDPSRIVLSFDGNLCQQSDNSECNNEGATVIHLRQIKPIDFPNLPRSPGGGTLLTLITEGGSEGRKIYQFKVVPTSGQPKYTVLSISPEVEQPTQVIPPAPPRRSLPIVQAPEPTVTTTWQAQTPAIVSRPSSAPSVVRLPSAATTTNSSATRQQIEATPNQNSVAPTPKVTATPKTIPVPKTILSTAERASQNAIAPYNPPPSNDSFIPMRQEQKVTNPRSTITKPTSNSSTPGSTNANKVKMSTRTTPSPTSANNAIASSSNNSIAQANALVRGLVAARQKGQINHGTTTWKKIQSVVRLMRRGDSKQKAAQDVGISPKLIDQLIIWGQRSSVASN